MAKGPYTMVHNQMLAQMNEETEQLKAENAALKQDAERLEAASSAKGRMAGLLEENARLRRIAVDLHWMARRYATGRMTYATEMHNDATRQLIAMGVKLNATGDDTVWAEDGNFGWPPEHTTNPEGKL